MNCIQLLEMRDRFPVPRMLINGEKACDSEYMIFPNNKGNEE